MVWDDVLPGPLRDESAEGESESEPMDVLAVVALPHHPAIAAQDQQQCASYKSKWTTFIPSPKRRSREEACLAAARMRDARGAHRRAKSKEQIADQVEAALAHLRAAGVLRDHGRTSVVKRKRVGSIVVVAGTTKTRLPYETVLSVAFSQVTRKSDLCRAFGLHKDTVSRAKVLTAFCSDKCDAELFRSLAAGFVHRRPVAFAASLIGDCTTQSLNLPMLGLEKHPHLSRSSWHVMSSLHRFSWIPNTGEGFECERESFTIDLVRPNVALVSTEDHTCLFQSLYKMPQVEHFSEFEKAGCHADFRILHFELDGFSANAYVPALRRADLLAANGSAPYITMHHCGNHAAHLNDNVTLRTCDETLFQWLTAGCCFYRMGGNFIRLLQSVPEMVNRFMLPVVIGHPPPMAATISAEVMDFSLRNFKSFADSLDACWSSDDETPRDIPSQSDREARMRRRLHRERHAAFKRAWQEYLQVFNGHVWASADGELGPHYSPFVVDFAKLKGKASTAIISLLFRALPVRPQKGKWTKMALCLDWHLVTMGFQSILKQLGALAYSKFHVRVSKESDGLDPTIVQDFFWHELRGKRFRYYFGDMSEQRLVSVIILSIVFEPCRFITSWYFRRASLVQRGQAQHSGRMAPLCDLVWLQASPFTRCCQYLSMVLTGRASRLKLLWGRRYGSFDEWARAEPAALLQLRRTAAAAYTWMYHRGVEMHLKMPWPLASVCDARRAVSERKQIWRHFTHNSSAETLDEYFSVPFKADAQHIDDIFHPEHAHIVKGLGLWSWAVALTIAPAEFYHGRNRSRAHPDQLWHNFVADSQCHENRLRLSWQVEAMQRSAGFRNGPARRPAPHQQGSSRAGVRRKKTRSAYDCFKSDYISEKKAEGSTIHVCDQAFMQDVAAQWKRIVREQPDLLARYEDEAEHFESMREQRVLQARPQERTRHEDIAMGGAGIVDLTGHSDVLASGDVSRFPVVPAALGYMSKKEVKASRPLTSNILHKFLHHRVEGGRQVGQSLDTLERQYKELHNNYATATRRQGDDDPRPPREPRFAPTPAGAAERRAVLEARLRAFLEAAAKPGKFADMAKRDLLLKVDVVADGFEARTCWLAVGGGNASAGVVPFRAFFLECEQVAARDDGRVELRLSRLPYCRTRRRLPFGGQVDVGLFSQFSHWGFAAHLLQGDWATSPNMCVAIRRHDWDPLGGDGYLVLGPADAPAAIEVLFPLAAPGDDPPDVEGGGEASGSHSGIDWDDVRPRWKKPRHTTSSRGAVAHGDEGVGMFGDVSEVFGVVVDAADCEHLVEELRLDESDDDDDASASCDDGAEEATGDVATGIDGAHESELAATEPAPPTPPLVTLDKSSLM